MPEAPTGTVTFLFTDIEGSTTRWEHHPDAMRTALARHDALLRSVITNHSGYVFKMVGDAVYAAFAVPAEAVFAALAAQRAVAAEEWGEVAPLRVRMALHTGAAQSRDDDYFGPTLNRVARVLSTGYGGQILLSVTTVELVRDALPAGASLKDLGEHALKDLLRPEHIFQLTIPDLPADFPVLKSLERHSHNLPVQPTPFLGREQEVRSVCSLLHRPEVRLVTLTGPGGIGKTRLALQVAADVTDQFADGVFLVPLAPVSEPEQVMPMIIQTLGIHEVGGQPPLALLKAALKDKHLLLLLDNVEQVITAAVQVAELLAACPKLTVLVTSRVVLHVQAEREFAVPPLSLPNLKRLPNLVTLSQYEAVALFIERAQAVKPDFAVTNANAPAVAGICARRDGLPLAIELAAARAKFFAPHALLTRLEQGLAVLTGGARDLPARQQTLRGAIAWSYNLLSSEEQKLFRRLAAFVDGWTIEAAEAVCRAAGGLEADVLDGLLSLVDRSLLRQEESTEGEPRFWMLQLLREFGLEALASAGESELTRQAHAEYYLGMGEQAEPLLKGPGQTPWLARLEQEHENLRAALTFLLERAREEGVVQAERALRFFAALVHYWLIRGYLSEGQHFLEAASGLFHAAERTVARARALAAAAELTFMLDDYAGACTLAEESAALARELGEKACLADALRQLAVARLMQGDAATGQLLIEKSMALAQEAENAWLLASLLFDLGRLLILQNKLAAARAQFEQCVSLFRELADKRALSKSLDWLAYSVLSEGDVGQAQALWQESLTLAREVGDQVRIQTVLRQLGYTAMVQGNWEQAENFLKESLALAREIGLKRGVATALNYSAQLARRRGDLAQAADLSKKSLILSREMGHMWDILEHLLILGEIIRDQGNLAQARALFEEGLSLAQQAGDKPFIRLHLVGLASLAVAEHQSQQAARLFGAAECLFDLRKELDSDPYRRTVYERDMATIRAQLGEEAFAAAWAQGRTMPLEQAIDEALKMGDEVG